MTNDLKRGGMEVRGAFDGDDELYISLDDLYHTRAEVAALRDHLTAVLGDGPKPSEVVPAATVEVGREYRLLPDSRYADGDARTGLAARHATRVVVAVGPDSDGDIRARALDGAEPGFTGYVDPKYLAPLDPSPTAPDPLAVVQAAFEEVAREVGGDARFPTSLGVALRSLARNIDARRHM